jgi:glutathione S-transferase
MKLFYYPGNANLAPHMLLEEIGVPYELVLVDRESNQHHSEEYLKLNPSGRIPVLVDGELVLYESAAICLHLVDSNPHLKLAPPLGTPQRANMYKWLMYLTNTLQPELLSYFYPERLCDDELAAVQIKRRAEQRVAGMLAILENTLKEASLPGAQTYLLGSAYSVVDPFLFMLCRWTRFMDKPARGYPYLSRYLSNLSERSAIKLAFSMEGIEAPYY